MNKGISVGIAALMLGIVLITTSYTYYSIKAGKPISNVIIGFFQQFQEADKISSLNIAFISFAQSSIERAVLECGSSSGLSTGYVSSWICNRKVAVPSKDVLIRCITGKASSYFSKLDDEVLNEEITAKGIIFDEAPKLSIEKVNTDSIIFKIEGSYHYKEHYTTYYGKLNILHTFPNIRIGYLYDGLKGWYESHASEIAGKMCRALLSTCEIPTLDDYLALGRAYQISLNDYFKEKGDEYVNCTVSLICHDEKIEPGCDPLVCTSWYDSKCSSEANCLASGEGIEYFTGLAVDDATEETTTYSAPDEEGVCIVCEETQEKCCGSDCALQCTAEPIVCRVACGSTFCCKYGCSPECDINRIYASALYEVKCEDIKYVTRYSKESDHMLFKTRIFQSYYRAYEQCRKCWCDCKHVGGSMGIGESPPEDSQEEQPPGIVVYGGISVDEVF